MSRPETITTVEVLRARVKAWRAAGDRVGLAPTMGALHAGHLALVGIAGERAQRVVVSIFVNPTQFAPTEDLAAYPRDLDADLDRLAGTSCDLVFAPDVQEMYPEGAATVVTVGGPAAELESWSRPHFFAGVATVVTKLLAQCTPDVAVFGEKDFQQLVVIRQLVRDLMLPVEIVAGATVRAADGLALSSRNAYLPDAERRRAAGLHAALAAAAAALADGAPAEATLAAARKAIETAGFTVDYLELRDAVTLGPVDPKTGHEARLLAAARIAGVRLIDNVPVTIALT